MSQLSFQSFIQSGFLFSLGDGKQMTLTIFLISKRGTEHEFVTFFISFFFGSKKLSLCQRSKIVTPA